ncbi:hypothetical protein Tco_0700302 [Tanacetum coccineum]
MCVAASAKAHCHALTEEISCRHRSVSIRCYPILLSDLAGRYPGETNGVVSPELSADITDPRSLLPAPASRVAAPRALVYVGLVTRGDARSSHMISSDAKSWVCLHIFTIILHNCPTVENIGTATGFKVKPMSSPTLLLTFSSIIFRSCLPSSYVDSETIAQADGAQSSRVPVPLPDDPYVVVRHAYEMDSIISLGQKNTLAEYMILSGVDNRPPMLDKDLYDTWKIRMELYMQNKEYGRMILESVKHGPLIWPTVEENGLIKTKKYAELSAAEKIQADCDMKATNIILQGLPTDIYSLVNHHRVAKDLWERVQLLMQGTSLTKQERECKLYDAFDKVTHIKGESLHTLPPEWSKFVTDVKLVKDLHTSNFDQLHAYLEQHKLHANEVRIMRERNQDPLAFVANQQMTPPHFNTYQSSYNNPQLQQ